MFGSMDRTTTKTQSKNAESVERLNIINYREFKYLFAIMYVL